MQLTIEDKVNALWIKLIGINNDGLIPKLEKFFTNDLHEVVKKSDLKELQNTKWKYVRIILEIILVIGMILSFLWGSGVLLK